MEGTVRRTRCIDLEVLEVDHDKRELEVKLVVSKFKQAQPCPKPGSAEVLDAEREAQFTVGLFDFPMIDSLRLENDDRVADDIEMVEEIFVVCPKKTYSTHLVCHLCVR